MALTMCSDCGEEYSNQANACVNCGAPNPLRWATAKSLLKFALWSAAGLFTLFLVIILLTPDGARDRRIIEECRREVRNAAILTNQEYDPSVCDIAPELDRTRR